ncbi:MAG TPA: hypothetical protein ENN12_01370 [Epsilonproteobacteria bacterium]|nr:hypothetical protein [Campylobacterota bacterium]
MNKKDKLTSEEWCNGIVEKFGSPEAKAFAKTRKNGQALEEIAVDVEQSRFTMMNRQGQIVDMSCFKSEVNYDMQKVFKAAITSGRNDEMIVLSFANDECKRAYEIGRRFAQDGNFFKKDGVPAELIELLKTSKTDRGEIERSYTDGKLSVIEEAQE